MSAPTTAEVRKRVDRIDRMRRAQGMTREAAAADHTLRTVALPLAEHRDALADEVARLKAILECGSSPYGMHRCCHCDSEVT